MTRHFIFVSAMWTISIIGSGGVTVAAFGKAIGIIG